MTLLLALDKTNSIKQQINVTWSICMPFAPFSSFLASEIGKYQEEEEENAALSVLPKRELPLRRQV